MIASLIARLKPVYLPVTVRIRGANIIKLVLERNPT